MSLTPVPCPVFHAFQVMGIRLLRFIPVMVSSSEFIGTSPTLSPLVSAISLCSLGRVIFTISPPLRPPNCSAPTTTMSVSSIYRSLTDRGSIILHTSNVSYNGIFVPHLITLIVFSCEGTLFYIFTLRFFLSTSLPMLAPDICVSLHAPLFLPVLFLFLYFLSCPGPWSRRGPSSQHVDDNRTILS